MESSLKRSYSQILPCAILCRPSLLRPDSPPQLRLALTVVSDEFSHCGERTQCWPGGPLSVGSQNCFLMLLGLEQLLWSNIHLRSFLCLINCLIVKTRVGVGCDWRQ